MPKNQGGDVDTEKSWGRGTWNEFFDVSFKDAQDILSDIGERVHPTWRGLVVELRGIYGELAIEPGGWIVSQQGQSPRKPDTEPDVATLNAMISVKNHGMDLAYGARLDDAKKYDAEQKKY